MRACARIARQVVNREVGVFDIGDGAVGALAVFGLDVDLEAEVVYAIADAVGQQAEAAKLDVVERGHRRILCVGPVDVVELHVAAELDGPLFGRHIDPLGAE